jgi:CBS domain-containing protein
VKAGAMLPIVDIARLHGLAVGSVHVGTGARLTDAVDAGVMSNDLAGTLAAGYDLALRLRLEAQVARHRDGLPADNRIEPGALPPLVRSQLRETFKAVRSAQSAIEDRYHTAILG